MVVPFPAATKGADCGTPVFIFRQVLMRCRGCDIWKIGGGTFVELALPGAARGRENNNSL